MAVATGTALLASGAMAAGTAYAAKKAGGGGSAPPPRNFEDEATATLRAQLNLAPQQYAAYQQYAPQYDAIDMQRLSTSLFGNRTFDSAAALASMDPEQRKQVEAEAARQGLDAGTWLRNHTFEQARNGDAVAQSGLQQFGGYSGGGLVDINNRLTQDAARQSREANTLQREADVADVGRLGGQVQGQLRDLNQGFYGQIDNIQNLANQGVGPYSTEAGLQGMFANGPQYGQVSGAGSIRDAQFGAVTDRVNPNTGFDRVTGTQAQGGIRANTNYRNVNAPTTDSSLSAVQGRINNATPSDIQQTLEQQARSELALGGQLSEQEQRNAQQQARGATAARGLGASNASMAAEVLNLDSHSRAREADRRAFASAVDAQGFGQRQSINQMGLAASQAAQNYAGMGLQAQMANQGAGLQANALGLQGQIANQQNRQFNAGQSLSAQLANQNAGMQANALNLQGQLANLDTARFNASGMFGASQANQGADLARSELDQRSSAQNAQNALTAYGQQAQVGTQLAGLEAQRQQQNWSQQMQALGAQQAGYFDPYQGVLGRSSVNQGTNAGLMGAGGGMLNQQVGGMFDPLNPYAADLYNTNYNAQAAANISNANNRAALTGAGIGMFGNMFGSWLGGRTG
jgi:hypothetical protein